MDQEITIKDETEFNSTSSYYERVNSDSSKHVIVNELKRGDVCKHLRWCTWHGHGHEDRTPVSNNAGIYITTSMGMAWQCV